MSLFKTSFIRRLYLPLLLLLCVGYAFRVMGPGYDFWAHAAIGRWVWNHKAFPEYSLFLWSVDRFPWVAHSWLSQLFFYGLIQAGGGWTPHGRTSSGNGPIVVMAFTTLVACAVWALLWRLWNRNSWSFGRRDENGRAQYVPVSFVTPLIFAMAIWASAPRYLPRQETLTALFMTLLLTYLIERRPARETDDDLPDDNRLGDNRLHDNRPAYNRFDDDNLSDEERLDSNAAERQRAANTVSSTRSSTRNSDNFRQRRDSLGSLFGVREVVLIATFALWVNLHALVLLGVVLVVATAFCDAIQDLFNPRARVLLVLAVLCALATLCNPFGLHWLDSALQLKPGNMANNIDEWKPPWQAENLHGYVRVEMTLAILALVAWAWNPNRRWAHAVWVVIMAILFLKQRRHLWLAALVFIAVAAANAGFFDSRLWWAKWKQLTGQSQSAHEPIPLAMRRLVQGAIVATLMISVNYGFLHPWTRTMVANNVPEATAYAIESGQKNGTLPRGRIFNDYANSSYLQWRLNRADARGVVPDRGLNPLYIDLLNAYPDGVHGLLNEYFVFLQGNADESSKDKSPALNMLKNRSVNIAYLPHELDKKWIANYFETDRAEWRLVHQGIDGRLWARRKPLPLKPYPPKPPKTKSPKTKSPKARRLKTNRLPTKTP